MTKDLSYAIKFMLNTAFIIYNQEPFMNRTVKDVLWGYTDPFLDFVNSLLPGILPFKGKFGLFADVSTAMYL